MAIREDLQRVLELQSQYDSTPTDAMKERGLLIRSTIPSQIRELGTPLRTAAHVEEADFLVEGKDGITRKARVPWVRFASKGRSPKATIGWYVVWLFREDGSGAYLALAHASTVNVGGILVDRSLEEASALTQWARQRLTADVAADSRITTKLDLGFGSLAKGYEKTTAIALFYPNGGFPSDDQLLTDMQKLAAQLSRLYEFDRLGLSPGKPSPEVAGALQLLEEISSPQRSAKQGFGLSQPERRAVELRAMSLAIEHLSKLGYSVEDTSRNKPYDLVARKDDEEVFVEVKGTTGNLGGILLTRNEVAHHKKFFPSNGLIVVSQIALSNAQANPVASGGLLNAQLPWKIDDLQLEPICYSYTVVQS